MSHPALSRLFLVLTLSATMACSEEELSAPTPTPARAPSPRSSSAPSITQPTPADTRQADVRTLQSALSDVRSDQDVLFQQAQQVVRDSRSYQNSLAAAIVGADEQKVKDLAKEFDDLLTRMRDIPGQQQLLKKRLQASYDAYVANQGEDFTLSNEIGGISDTMDKLPPLLQQAEDNLITRSRSFFNLGGHDLGSLSDSIE